MHHTGFAAAAVALVGILAGAAVSSCAEGATDTGGGSDGTGLSGTGASGGTGLTGGGGVGGAGGSGLTGTGGQSSGGGPQGGAGGGCVPETEVCDGLDNDCDNIVDNGCPCADGDQQDCYSGPPATRGVGECADGTQSCDLNGVWGPCQGEQLPAIELCDGLDNDCAGGIDDGDPGGGGVCDTGLAGVCAAGTEHCQSASLQCAQDAQPSAEVCGDSLDNDCDNVVDNGCTCDPLNPGAVCGSGFHCIPQSVGDPQCVSPVGFGVLYDPCTVAGDCAAIYECVVPSDAGAVCMQWCRIGGNDCAGGTSCYSLTPAVTIGAQEWGVCWGGVPPGWICPTSYYAAGDGCDCGCMKFDPDCASLSQSFCEFCLEGCASGDLDCSLWGCTDSWCSISSVNNAVCI